VQDETTYKLMKLIEEHPQLSQREIAQRMGISLGKANYCLNALIEKGFVKAKNFYNAKNKTPYIYNLTPSGLEEKARVTYRFLKCKMQEYKDIKAEITRLKAETERLQINEDRDGQ
jgi:EPS-associated MarR family transcriptional regulator